VKFAKFIVNLDTETIEVYPISEMTIAEMCEIDGKYFIVIIDYFSRFIEIAFLQSITSAQVIGSKMKEEYVCTWGISEELVSDNGTQPFRKSQRIKNSDIWTFSSPHYPLFNKEAESAVKMIVKRILR
jgi:hypothetical protein